MAAKNAWEDQVRVPPQDAWAGGLGGYFITWSRI